VRVGGENTARMVGLDPRKGVLAPGAGVIVIVDPKLEETVGYSFGRAGRPGRAVVRVASGGEGCCRERALCRQRPLSRLGFA
jgi:hypothetical protein